jgi:hypothetical protein
MTTYTIATIAQTQLISGQEPKRGEVFKELPDIVSPANTSYSGKPETPSKNESTNVSSMFGDPSNEDFDEDILDKNLPAATDKTLNPVILCSNPNTEIPCNGTDEADNMKGTEGEDYIYGLDGNDMISALGSTGGSRGFDVTEGGGGEDIIHGGSDNDIVNGNNGNDKIFGEEGIDTLYGAEGNDEIDGGSGNDRIWGNAGEDTINGGEGNDMIYHGDEEQSPLFNIDPDGSRDNIDCGPGQDEAWISMKDGDIIENCEEIHKSGPDLRSDANTGEQEGAEN